MIVTGRDATETRTILPENNDGVTGATWVYVDDAVEACAYTVQSGCGMCGSPSGCNCGVAAGYPQRTSEDGLPYKYMFGVDQFSKHQTSREPKWRDGQMVPWEKFAYGEYVGPYRTPHVPEYRVRVGDQFEFLFTRQRQNLGRPYELNIGDVIQLRSTNAELNVTDVTIQWDGRISLPILGNVNAAGKTLERLTADINQAYVDNRLYQDPAVTISITKGNTPLEDVFSSVGTQSFTGGQREVATVTADGTVQLPLLGSVPAIGLSLNELGDEINARYEMRVHGIYVTPKLTRAAPRRAFVLGQVGRPGLIELDGPTTAMQAIAQAQGWIKGGNLRQVIIFRRDENWRLMATKLDLAAALNGKAPHPADEIWLRDSDIVLVPKQPIQRMTEAIDLYLRQGVYSIFPQQQLVFNFDNFLTF